MTVSGASGGGGGYGPPIVYATYAPPIPSMPTSATWESGRGFEPDRELPKFARDSMAQTTSNAAAQTQAAAMKNKTIQTKAAKAIAVDQLSQTAVSMMPPKATYAPRDQGASTSATWESGSGFKPEKREPQRLTDHGVSLTPKHASVQTHVRDDMSIIERVE